MARCLFLLQCLLSVFLLECSIANATILDKDPFTRHTKIRLMEAAGDLAVHKMKFQTETKRLFQSVLFAFDLDETITNYAYKGRRAKAAEVHLKAGVGRLFAEILKKGHRIAIITANVSSDVESFLMDELGFDFEKAEEFNFFREWIRIKQPMLPLALRLAEPLKPQKGTMLREAVNELRFEGIPIDGIIFADDKTGFHYQVQKQARSFPIVSLRVGHRLHWAGDPIGAMLDNRNLVNSGRSTEFMKLMTKVLDDPYKMNSLLESAQSSILTHSAIVRINSQIFKTPLETNFPTDLATNKQFASWALRELEDWCGVYSDSKKERRFFSKFGYHTTRKFRKNEKPISPRYL